MSGRIKPQEPVARSIDDIGELDSGANVRGRDESSRRMSHGGVTRTRDDSPSKPSAVSKGRKLDRGSSGRLGLSGSRLGLSNESLARGSRSVTTTPANGIRASGSQGSLYLPGSVERRPLHSHSESRLHKSTRRQAQSHPNLSTVEHHEQTQSQSQLQSMHRSQGAPATPRTLQSLRTRSIEDSSADITNSRGDIVSLGLPRVTQSQMLRLTEADDSGSGAVDNNHSGHDGNTTKQSPINAVTTHKKTQHSVSFKDTPDPPPHLPTHHPNLPRRATPAATEHPQHPENETDDSEDSGDDELGRNARDDDEQPQDHIGELRRSPVYNSAAALEPSKPLGKWTTVKGDVQTKKTKQSERERGLIEKTREAVLSEAGRKLESPKKTDDGSGAILDGDINAAIGHSDEPATSQGDDRKERPRGTVPTAIGDSSESHSHQIAAGITVEPPLQAQAAASGAIPGSSASVEPSPPRSELEKELPRTSPLRSSTSASSVGRRQASLSSFASPRSSRVEGALRDPDAPPHFGHSRSPSRTSVHPAPVPLAAPTSPGHSRSASRTSLTSAASHSPSHSPSQHRISPTKATPVALAAARRAATSLVGLHAKDVSWSSASPGSGHTRHGSYGVRHATPAGGLVSCGPGPVVAVEPATPKLDPHTYTATPLQQDVYRSCVPSLDPDDPPPLPAPVAVEELYIAQCYLTKTHLNPHTVRKAVECVVTRWPVLGAKVWSNPRVIDGDVMCVEPSDAGVFVAGEDGGTGVVEEIGRDKVAPGPRGELDVSALGEFAKKWVRRQAQSVGVGGGKGIGTGKVFVFCGGVGREWSGGCVAKGGMIAAQSPSVKELAAPGEDWTVVVVVWNRMVSDERTVTRLAKEILHFNSNAISKSDDKSREVVPFAAYARSLANKVIGTVPSRSIPPFLRSQCFDTVTEAHVAPEQRRGIEAKRTQLLAQVEALTKQRGASLARKRDLELDLATLREQRIRMDDLARAGEVTTLYDTTSGEMLRITVEAKKALLRAVLGPDVEIGDADSVLAKHGVSAKARQVLKVKGMTIEDFARLDEVEVEEGEVGIKEKKRILALVEHVRNRIRDCVLEESRVKFGIERRILKGKRELESLTDQIKVLTDRLYTTDIAALNLMSLLNPATVEVALKAPRIYGDMEVKDGLVQQERLPGCGNKEWDSEWGVIPFEVGQDTVDSLSKLYSEWRNLRKARTRMSSSAQDADFDDGAAADGSDPSTPTNEERSVEAALLACLAILVRHVSGESKFLVGCRANVAGMRNGTTLGPLEMSVPVKVDMSGKAGSVFLDVFGAMWRGLRVNEDKAAVHHTQAAMKVVSAMTVRYAFTRTVNEETNAFTRSVNGNEAETKTTVKEDTNETKSDASTLVWSHVGGVSRVLDLDVRYNPAGAVRGHVKFHRASLDATRAAKWTDKLLTIAESVAVAGQKATVPQIVSSRHHQPKTYASSEGARVKSLGV
ncbi:hypothetical protein M427DRAFT_496279 [Gonapodya prolifera JEL478]|uniref:Uncharacterized protein n=1 Tax=Gonapodya prolifera (strain JEL478) TaxID=1344416 RepID=A0A139AG63_GONPJ|nr:hypothetical protein M427DRAFT_496279 [Gonapodya prolifera JEL478]|eukprot:KXS15786.1 hypothetical protein M427DRAFT_496279 [Gonapodya prolifera JEL478]